MTRAESIRQQPPALLRPQHLEATLAAVLAAGFYFRLVLWKAGCLRRTGKGRMKKIESKEVTQDCQLEGNWIQTLLQSLLRFSVSCCFLGFGDMSPINAPPFSCEKLKALPQKQRHKKMVACHIMTPSSPARETGQSSVRVSTST